MNPVKQTNARAHTVLTERKKAVCVAWESNLTTNCILVGRSLSLRDTTRKSLYFLLFTRWVDSSSTKSKGSCTMSNPRILVIFRYRYIISTHMKPRVLFFVFLKFPMNLSFYLYHKSNFIFLKDNVRLQTDLLQPTMW